MVNEQSKESLAPEKDKIKIKLKYTMKYQKETKRHREQNRTFFVPRITSADDISPCLNLF
jgi:hypothetical protein